MKHTGERIVHLLDLDWIGLPTLIVNSADTYEYFAL